jgi:hypothetical protein
MELKLPKLDKRLKKRYQKLVLEHLNTNDDIAAGIRALPGKGKAFTSTQGAWRFYANPRVSLSKLGEPLIEEARGLIGSECGDYALVVHDWSNLSYQTQAQRKTDLIELGHQSHGYELQNSLLVSDRTGMPLISLDFKLTAADGVYIMRSDKPQPRQAPLDEISETMVALRALAPGLPLVHIIDQEGNSVWHWRLWQSREDFFLARVSDLRKARWQGRRLRLREIGPELTWRPDKVVEVTADLQAQAFVAETEVVFAEPAYRRLPNGKRQVIPGEPLSVRLIIVQLRLPDERVCAEWYLVTNLPPEVPASVIVEWYYWRWTIESATKLFKSAGLHLEQWQQEGALAIAKRLFVAAMACVVVWQVQRSDNGRMASFRQLLLRLSGRQIRPGQAPASALLAGLWTFLSVLDALQTYDLKELLQLASLLPVGDMLERIKLRQGFSP